MSSETIFQDKGPDPDKSQGAVEPASDDPGKYDPLTQPDLEDDDAAQDWNERDRKLPEADEQTPLSDDRR
ncbi:hypothetical protein [Pseudomonas umsongensis]|jgi:hypothetical protein|uniref:hypothetical protein n=1 Tax=Pseudomonas umsongensis TaxID=198618 RepID=UPI0015BBB6E1|nr:hypothetical protein [Pseudomonas umsongensis]NWL23279.1 hypothetical protein [Pseudomonas umsongensis]